MHRIFRLKPNPDNESKNYCVVHVAFEVATDPKISSIVGKKVSPGTLLPIELAPSPIEKIRPAYSFQTLRIAAP